MNIFCRSFSKSRELQIRATKTFGSTPRNVLKKLFAFLWISFENLTRSRPQKILTLIQNWKDNFAFMLLFCLKRADTHSKILKVPNKVTVVRSTYILFHVTLTMDYLRMDGERGHVTCGNLKLANFLNDS